MSNSTIDKIVLEIIEDVKKRGDAALLHYARQFDAVENPSVIPKPGTEVFFTSRLVATFEEAIKNIKTYHEFQRPQEFKWCPHPGVQLGQRIVPIQRVAIYVPGGTAAYPSTVFMNVIPAQIAGVKEIVVFTPPNPDGTINPYVSFACKMLGIDEIYAVGGAQAVAAAAYGTESIKRVDKIVGPGNIFVATAKKHVFGDVAIDMIAGPSEIAIIADASSNPAYIAADLLAQAEHDEKSRLYLILTKDVSLKDIESEISYQLNKMSRKSIAKEALNQYFKVMIVDTIEEGIILANSIAPEHLELAIESPFKYLTYIENAGSVFLGHYTPETLGDYYAGCNHTLPTQGTARFSSPLGVYDFIKRPSYVYYDKKSLDAVAERVGEFAEIEGLTAHKFALEVRKYAGQK